MHPAARWRIALLRSVALSSGGVLGASFRGVFGFIGLVGFGLALPGLAFDPPPGTIIDHSPAASGVYIGSPGLAILPSGAYLVSHDEFGPGSTEHRQAITKIFRSTDRGQTWTSIGRIEGQFWSSLFVHNGAVYLLGTDRHHGNLVIRRSRDEGRSWTAPTNSTTGLIRADGQYHCAPVPVLTHNGKLWRALEHREPPTGWGITYCAGMLSAPVEADLLDVASWTFSNFLPGQKNWLSGTFGGWLEGNAVAAPDGTLYDVLRVDTPTCPEKAALVKISADGRVASFNSDTGFIDFAGGAKKFTIRRDLKGEKYWAIVTPVRAKDQKTGRPGGIRNTLALAVSPDLQHWSVRSVLLNDPDTGKHGFQYVDWLFEGEDIIAVCRTAFDDEQGGAHNFHDANYLTFHRIKNFRELQSKTDPLS